MVLEPFSRMQLLYYYLKIFRSSVLFLFFQNSSFFFVPFFRCLNCRSSWRLLIVEDRVFPPAAMILRAAACLWSMQNTQELELGHTGAKGSRDSRRRSGRTGSYQTSTDWIWFICALITWILFRIFFWCPAKVTPTRRMSLGEERKQTQISGDTLSQQNKITDGI